MEQPIIRKISPEGNPGLYSQVLNLRNQLLRLPIGLDLFQEDLAQEVNHVFFVATTTSTLVAKSNDNNSGNNPEKIDTDKSKNRETLLTEGKDEEEKVVGCIILVPFGGDGKTMKIRQMAVSPHFQGQGLGFKLLTSTEDYAKQQGKTRLYLHGRAHAVGFYLKFGFTITSQQEFLELGIPHHAMEKIL